MTTAKQKSVRDFRGRFKKRRYASPSEARQIFDRMYEKAERAREAAEEAHLRTPEGERERQARNAATLARMRETKKNPRRRGRITPGEAEQIFTGIVHPEGKRADFHSLRSDDVQYLLDTAKEIGYRAPKGASGSKARYFWAYLKNSAARRIRENPRRPLAMAAGRAFLIRGIHKDKRTFYWNGSKLDTERAHAKTFANQQHAFDEALSVARLLPKTITSWRVVAV